MVGDVYDLCAIYCSITNNCVYCQQVWHLKPEYEHFLRVPASTSSGGAAKKSSSGKNPGGGGSGAKGGSSKKSARPSAGSAAGEGEGDGAEAGGAQKGKGLKQQTLFAAGGETNKRKRSDSTTDAANSNPGEALELPKRPKTAFWFFVKEKRVEVESEMPDSTVSIHCSR